MPTPLSRILSQVIVLVSLVFIVLTAGTGPAEAQVASGPPLLFVENVGQWPAAANGETVRFQVSSPSASLSLTDSALWFTSLEPVPLTAEVQSLGESPTESSLPQRGVALKVSFVNANPQPSIEPFQRLDTVVSYFKGNNSAQWQTHVPIWGGVRYVDLYPGLDLEISSENGQLVQRLVVKAGDVAAQAAPEMSPLAGVRWQVEGADSATLDGAGGLHLTTPLGDITLPLLQAVTADGVPVDLAATPPEVNGLEVAAPFSATPLPPPGLSAQIAGSSDLIYSTFIGSNLYFDSSEDIAIDSTGAAYLTGRAYTTFPSTPGVFDPTIDGFFNDAFVAKLSPDGSHLVYSTFLGGDAYAETGFAIAIDGAGNAYVTGFTVSTDFPTTPTAFDHDLSGDHDGFVAKINPDGTALLYASFLGGNAEDYGYDIALDNNGQAYVTGFTRSTDLPTTPGAFASSYSGGFSDGYVVKVAADGSTLIYATYLGGSEDESSEGLVVDSTGSAYVTGYTGSSNFPTTPGAWDTGPASADAFVLKLNPAGSTLIYSTLLGGSVAEGGRAIAIDNLGSAYVTGRTDSPDFPTTPDAFDTSHSSANDIFVAKLTPDGSDLLYGTYLGGNNEEEGRDLAVDAAGSAYITGFTSASDFPTTPNAYAPTCHGCASYFEGFVAKLNPNGTGLVYATYLGGTNHDYGYALAQNDTGYVYVAGETQSPDFPTTTGAFDTSLSGLGSGFVSKLLVGTGTGAPPPPLAAHNCAPSLMDTFTVQNEPRGLALDPTRQRLYVANFGSDSVSVVDTRNDNVLQTLSGIDSANGLTYDANHNLIWVTNYQTDQVTPIQANGDATSFSVLSPVATGAGPWGVAYDPLHDFIYVANSRGNSVTVINAASRTTVTTLTGSFNQPFHLAANPLTGKVYVSNFGSASVTVLNGSAVSRVVSLFDSRQPYGITVDETRNLVYVATVSPHRIVTLGPVRGGPDQFLGWAAFNRGFGNPRRPVPLRVIAVNPGLGPSGDGGHLWTTTSTGDGSETNQALFIPKGWGGYFHFPWAQPVGEKPGEGIAIDRLTNRVYIASGTGLGTVAVLGDHTTVCGSAAPADASEDTNQINVDFFAAPTQTSHDLTGDGLVNILDLTFIASRYGSNDPAADLTGDGQVNILDLVLVASEYGQPDAAAN